MNTIDRLLENLAKEVELYGRSGSESIYLPNLSFTVEQEDFQYPIAADLDGAMVDIDWFLKCANKYGTIPHPCPDKSFWLRIFGEDAQPYGAAWNLRTLRDHFDKDLYTRRAVLMNPRSADAPPCILAYHFYCDRHRTMDVTVSMRSSDVKKVLPQDLLMTWFLLKHIANDNFVDMGSITFNISNAHVYYEDCEWQEENTIDGLD